MSFFESNHLFVRSLDSQVSSDSAGIAKRAVNAFVLDHYQLDPSLPQVAMMLSRVQELDN